MDLAVLSAIGTNEKQIFLYTADHKQGKYFGCYRDDRKDRDLVNFHVDYREDNTPEKCIDYCLRGSKFTPYDPYILTVIHVQTV